jgi:uncharacterized RDD family membrane protein YckC
MQSLAEFNKILEGKKKSELEGVLSSFPGNNPELNSYAGFWKRLSANILDFILIYVPFIIILIFSRDWPPFWYIALRVITPILLVCFNLFCLYKYGGTPGKLILGIKVIRLDGKKLEFHNAFLRYSVEICDSIFQIVIFISIVSNIDFTYIKDLPSKELSIYWKKIYPVWYKPIKHIFALYSLSELIVLLTNKKRRAIHDFIAGTIVINKQNAHKANSLNKSKTKQKMNM